MSKRDPALLIADILTSIGIIQTHTAGLSCDSFLADSRTVEAVERNFEIIGKAENQIPKPFQQENPQIVWHSLV